MLESVTLDQLRMLITINDTGGFSAAARELNRAQSAISHAMRSLENALELDLFDRTTRTPRLTEAGTVILGDARELVARATEMKARAAGMARQIEPELSLAVDAMFPRQALAEALKALGGHYPHVPVTLHTEVLGAVEARVLDGTCRLGIAPHRPDTPLDPLERRYLTEITLISVVAPEHPLAGFKGPIPRREMEQHTQLVLTDRGGGGGTTLRGVVSPRVWRFADIAMRHAFVCAGLGFCNMPEEIVRDDLAAGRLVQIVAESWRQPGYKVPLSIVYRRGEAPGPAASWFINYLGTLFPSGREAD